MNYKSVLQHCTLWNLMIFYYCKQICEDQTYIPNPSLSNNTNYSECDLRFFLSFMVSLKSSW
jgi:hypothetical protein